jgi:hypothetical protein
MERNLMERARNTKHGKKQNETHYKARWKQTRKNPKEIKKTQYMCAEESRKRDGKKTHHQRGQKPIQFGKKPIIREGKNQYNLEKNPSSERAKTNTIWKKAPLRKGDKTTHSQQQENPIYL